MADTRPADSDRSVGAGRPEERVSEAFALLGNETRLGILLALWEEQVPLADDNTVPFSRIFERVDIEDRGNLSYHLAQLSGVFITQHGDRGGYELRIPGLKLVRTVVAGTGTAEASLDPTPLDLPCPLCGGQTTISYRDGVVFVACTACSGMAPGAADVDGVLSAAYFEPAGLADRSPAELHAASLAATLSTVRSFVDGVCPTCSGPVDRQLVCCPDHGPDGCERCGRRAESWAQFECRVCKDFGFPNLGWLALVHPSAVAFYADHGVPTRVHAGDVEAAREVYGLVFDHDLTVLATDPPRVRVTVSRGGDDLALTFDETTSVVDVRR